MNKQATQKMNQDGDLRAQQEEALAAKDEQINKSNKQVNDQLHEIAYLYELMKELDRKKEVEYKTLQI